MTIMYDFMDHLFNTIQETHASTTEKNLRQFIPSVLLIVIPFSTSVLSPSLVPLYFSQIPISTLHFTLPLISLSLVPPFSYSSERIHYPQTCPLLAGSLSSQDIRPCPSSSHSRASIQKATEYQLGSVGD